MCAIFVLLGYAVIGLVVIKIAMTVSPIMRECAKYNGELIVFGWIFWPIMILWFIGSKALDWAKKPVKKWEKK